MELEHFSSDSTYCSLYENKKQPEERKFKRATLTDLKFLDKTHKEVILHFEGKKLIGRIEVVQRLKQISKMKLINPKDQCFAEKIQSSLLKIYSLLKQFEKSFSNSNLSPTFNRMENFSFVDDFQVLEVNNEDPKQILLRTTTVDNEVSSFPLEMLTNDNFISSSHQNVYTPLTDPLAEIVITRNETSHEESASKKTVSNYSEYFISESSELKMKNYSSSMCSAEAFISTDRDLTIVPSEIMHSKEAAVCAKNCSNLNSNKINSLVHKTKENNTSQDNTTEGKNKSEEHNVMQQLSKLCENLSIENKYNTTSELVNFKYNKSSVNVKNINLESVTDLGNLFKESYNLNIYNLCCDNGKNLNNNKIWPDIENYITNGEHLAEKITNTLGELSKKLRLEETEIHKTQHAMLRGNNIHDFSAEENAKLDIEDLMNKNQERLEQIFEEFQLYLDENKRLLKYE